MHAAGSLWPRRLNLKLTSPSYVVIISDVFVSVESYTTAKLRLGYNTNKIQPDGKKRKQGIRSKINYIVPFDRYSRI